LRSSATLTICPYPLRRTRRPLSAEGRPTFISVAAWGAICVAVVRYIDHMSLSAASHEAPASGVFNPDRDRVRFHVGDASHEAPASGVFNLRAPPAG